MSCVCAVSGRFWTEKLIVGKNSGFDRFWPETLGFGPPWLILGDFGWKQLFLVDFGRLVLIDFGQKNWFWSIMAGKTLLWPILAKKTPVLVDFGAKDWFWSILAEKTVSGRF